MKHSLRTPVILLLISGIICCNSCKKNPPDVTTTDVSNITHTTAKSGGEVTYNGGSEVTARGVCWDITPNPTVNSNKTSDGNGNGIFVSTIAGLTPNTKYYVRGYAVNSEGTAYGNSVSFTTNALLQPTVTTSPVTSVTTNSAKSGGNIGSDGGAEITARGVCWNNLPNATTSNFKTTDGTGKGDFTSSVIGLQRYTIYYLRAYATNSIGTSYGSEEITFRTKSEKPILTTNTITSMNLTTATTGGNINDDGGSTIKKRGVCWSTSDNPTILLNPSTSDGTGKGSYASYLTGLNPSTTYFVRAYAINEDDTAYGVTRTFPTTEGVLDVNRNAYNIVTIGTQVWMVQNLKATSLNDKTEILNITDAKAWETTTSPGYCYYNNDKKNAEKFGLLYNWHTVNSGRLCPKGWHVPTASDINTLEIRVGGLLYAGKLKEAGTTNWSSPNTGTTNQYGFTALPGGSRRILPLPLNQNYVFIGLGNYGKWWVNASKDNLNAYNIGLTYSSVEGTYSSTSKNDGHSIRCVKD